MTALMRELDVAGRGHHAAVDARFLAHFALRRLRGGFARFDVAFRKDPVRALVLRTDDKHLGAFVRCTPHDPARLLHHRHQVLLFTAPSQDTSGARRFRCHRSQKTDVIEVVEGIEVIKAKSP
jgi:hypothetical protein